MNVHKTTSREFLIPKKKEGRIGVAVIVWILIVLRNYNVLKLGLSVKR